MSKLNKLCEKIKKIDWRGIITGFIGIVLILSIIIGGICLGLYLFQLVVNWILDLFRATI